MSQYPNLFLKNEIPKILNISLKKIKYSEKNTIQKAILIKLI